VAGVEEGLYVAGFMGRGFDPASGRLSAPAIGARIRNGRLAEPVAGAILTGPLEAFLKGIDAAGDRVERAGNLAAPALRVRGVMVAGR
jgi:PmbA protein